MNLTPLTPSLSPSGERVSVGPVRGNPVGSRSQCMLKKTSGLSMNLKVGRVSPLRAVLRSSKPRRARSDAPYRFMVPMHARKRKRALHAPSPEIRMTNDEIRRNTESEDELAIAHQSAFRHWSFVIRHLTPVHGPNARSQGRWGSP